MGLKGEQMAAQLRPEGTRDVPGGGDDTPFVWRVDPSAYALRAAGTKRLRLEAEPPPLVCAEVGRRLLLLQHTFSSWVLRRVEKLAFDEGRRVIRRSSIELRVPEEAPVLETSDGEFYLVPLSILRRRTLVNLDISDEDGRTVRMLGLRFTQALDESMLRAAAAIAGGSPDLDQQVNDWIREAISGTRSEVRAATRGLGSLRCADDSIVSAPVFSHALDRLQHNFTLYALLNKKCGRSRLIRLSIDEPTEWKTQRPHLSHESGVTRYEPMRVTQRISPASALGWKPVRLRFLTPSAEHCASYHFEFTAPADVRVARASLLAGRPQQDAPARVGKGVSLDDMTPVGPTAGLHAVEVPSGSLCRAQIDLRVRTQGWLGTLAASALACVAVLFTVVFHAYAEGGKPGHWSPDQVTNIVLLLVTVSAGAATYVAQSHANVVAATMARGLRVCGTALMALPAAAAMVLVYLAESEVADPGKGFWGGVLVLVLALAVVFAVVIVGAWVLALLNQAAARAARSAWDNSASDDALDEPMTGECYQGVMDELEFDSPAVGFHTSEGWFERYDWDDLKQKEVTDVLREARGGVFLRCQCHPAADSS